MQDSEVEVGKVANLFPAKLGQTWKFVNFVKVLK